jgi:hypothetical protein
MSGVSKLLGPFAGPVPMLLDGKNPLDNPLSPIGIVKGALADDDKKKKQPEAKPQKKQADTLLGTMGGGVAAPLINRAFK